MIRVQEERVTGRAVRGKAIDHLATRAGLALFIASFLLAPACGEEMRVPARRLVDALDSLQVERHWQPDDPVDWRTGRYDPASVRLKSHCSAFVAAVCDRFGVYILRPPEHSELLLANAQCVWLLREGRELGWRRVDSDVEAQSLANLGEIVVACYRNPDAEDAGHIAVVRPSNKSRARIELEGPDIAQAGARNYNRTSVKNGFRLHPGAWQQRRIEYFAHGLEHGDPIETEARK